MSRIRWFHFITEYNYNISDFFAKYNKEKEKKTHLLNNYLIYCFVHKKFNDIKYIINHFNLDIINTRLTFNHISLKFNLSLLCFSVFFDDIDFVKYLLKHSGKEYIIDQDYCDYYNGEDNFKFDKGTPLFVAASYTKNCDIINFLVECGANINARDCTNSTPIMNILLWDDEKDKEIIKYYQFLISRGANINLQNKAGNTVLHHVIRQNKFNVALQLIDQCGANPFLLNNRKRDGIMEFIICLNLCDDYNGWLFKNIKSEYIENLLMITNANPDLIYELFAASSRDGYISLKHKYFKKVKNSMILHNDYNSKYWKEKFNAIVGNDNDGHYFIQSVKILQRLLHVYDFDNIIYIILYKILPYYNLKLFRTFRYKDDKFIMLIIYVIDLIFDNLESFKKLYGDVSNIYERIFIKFFTFVFRNFEDLLLENILETYRHIMYKFLKHKYFLENEKEYYCQLVEVIHIYIYKLYKKCFYDTTKRKIIENYIKDEYPINLLDYHNNCILHNFFQDNYIIFDKEDYVDEIVINFLFFIITHNDFKHLNLRNNENLTPLQLAMFKNKNKDIIQLLLDHGSVVLDLDNLHPEYDSLNISQRYFTLQNLTAAKIKQEERDYLPKPLQNLVVH